MASGRGKIGTILALPPLNSRGISFYVTVPKKEKHMDRTDGRTSLTHHGGRRHLLQQLFVDMLEDIYYAEKHLTKALPKMSKATTTDELRRAFDDHLTQTEQHVDRLEKVFGLMGKKAKTRKCEAIEGLTKEADDLKKETEKDSLTRDVALIAAGQKVEHYEIATYGTLVQLASNMHLNEVVSLLEENLKEEKAADLKLTNIAEHNINWQALEAEG